ncbi:Fusicoccadiene synthase [Naviculisporaceae sp. PSN 640]
MRPSSGVERLQHAPIVMQKPKTTGVIDYQHSYVVDPSSTYDTEGLSDGIPLRVHRDQILEDLGCIRAQEDWRRYIAPEAGFLRGLLGPQYSVTSVLFPETKPERLEMLSYFNEFVALHDDIVEEAEQKVADEQNDEARDVCAEAAAGIAMKKERKRRGRQLMIAHVAEKMLALDRGPATTALQLWTEWFEKGSGRQNRNLFESLEDYLEYRVLDIGQMLTSGFIIFGMGLNISKEEMELLSSLCRPAWVAIGLTNDIFSYAKEKKAADIAGEGDHFCNAISVLMWKYSISAAQAEALLRAEIKKNVAQYVGVVRQTLPRTDLSKDVRAFVEAAQYMISGNVAWSKDTPRYNPTAKYNSRQVEWMAHGTPTRASEEKEGERPVETGSCQRAGLLVM